MAPSPYPLEVLVLPIDNGSYCFKEKSRINIQLHDIDKANKPPIYLPITGPTCKIYKCIKPRLPPLGHGVNKPKWVLEGNSCLVRRRGN
jgi:hypothetical protein